MGTVGEICILVKYSPKQEKLLGKIVENIEGELSEELSAQTSPSKLDKLSSALSVSRRSSIIIHFSSNYGRNA